MKIVLRGSAEHLELNGGIRRIETVSPLDRFRCNYRCRKCASMRHRKQFERAHRQAPIALDDMKGIHERAAIAGARVLSFMGEGETLMNPHLVALANHAKSIGLIPLLYTNGSLLKDKLAEELAGAGASLIVSIDSFNPELYAKLAGTGPGALEAVLENLENARKIFSGTVEGAIEVVRIGVNMVVSRPNARELRHAARYCEENRFVFCANTPIHAGNATKNRGDYVLTRREIRMQQKFSRPYGTDSAGKCMFLRNGVTYSLQTGRIFACPYTFDADGDYGRMSDYADLSVIQRKVLADVVAFEDLFGAARCIIRHPAYGAFATGQHRPDGGAA